MLLCEAISERKPTFFPGGNTHSFVYSRQYSKNANLLSQYPPNSFIITNSFLYYRALKAKQITIRKIFSSFLFRGVGFACNLTFSRSQPVWDLKKKSTIWEHAAHGFSGHLSWKLYCLMPRIISAKWYKVGVSTTTAPS